MSDEDDEIMIDEDDEIIANEDDETEKLTYEDIKDKEEITFEDLEKMDYEEIKKIPKTILTNLFLEDPEKFRMIRREALQKQLNATSDDAESSNTN